MTNTITDRFTTEELDEFGKIADHLAQLIADSFEVENLTEEDLGMLTVARAYMKLYITFVHTT